MVETGPTRTRTDDPWVPLDVPDSVTRASPDVIDWLDPLHRPRYQPRGGNTYCNIFAWDWSRAMGCEIPHVVDGREQTINASIDWLRAAGPSAGWFPGCGVAAGGTLEPTVVTWRNPEGHGHIAVVRAAGSSRWEYRYAQAGTSCYADAALGACFGKPKWQFLQWWHHRSAR